MTFSRKSLGVEISPGGVAFALLGGNRTAPRLERIAFRPFTSGTLRVSLKEANILDPHSFCTCLSEAHALLLHKGTRLSLALPDAVGRVLLLDVEGRFKNRSEGLDIIRWKLKKNMPFDVADAHLDYQLLKVRESGEMSLLVALVSRSVISQYEELCTTAGFIPARIDLTGFNLCRTFQQRLEQLGDGGLISFYGSTLGIMLFSDGSLEFLRFKELPGSLPSDNRVFMEISNSLLAYRERFQERIIKKIVCIAPPDAAGDFCAMVAEATGSEPLLLETKAIVKPSDSAPADQESLFPFTAAIGAALRSL